MKWFENHKKATIIGLILVVLIIIVTVSYANSGSSSPLGKGAKSVLTTIQKPFFNAASGVKSAFRGIVQFKSVVRENESLKEQVADLNKEIIQLKLSREELNQLEDLSKALNYEHIQNNYDLKTGSVVAIDGSDWLNIFTVNIGTDHGVKKDFVVMSGEGLIGRVMEVGSNWSKVVSLTDESNSVSFKTLRDGNLLGVMSGDGKGNLKGYMLSQDFMVKKGDELITSGMGMYPEGIPIGKVTKIKVNENSLLKDVEIEPAANLKSLQKVIIIIPKS